MEKQGKNRKKNREDLGPLLNEAFLFWMDALIVKAVTLIKVMGCAWQP